jgi:hypothetical protein
MDIDLDTSEEKKDDVWTVTGRAVVLIRRVYQPIVQGNLPFESPTPREKESGDDDNDDQRR